MVWGVPPLPAANFFAGTVSLKDQTLRRRVDESETQAETETETETDYEPQEEASTIEEAEHMDYQDTVETGPEGN